MSQELEEIPLFPLKTVLFPYAQIQLHVFEERYRQMVRDCLELGRSFGIVLIRSGQEVGGQAEPYMVGTTVHILKVHTYDDGRMDVLGKGERRFRIRRLDDTRPYPVGWVEPVTEADVEDDPEADILAQQAREECQMWVKQHLAREDVSVHVQFPEDKIALSFQIANLLNIDQLEKQRLLETTDTCDRLESLVQIFKEQILVAKPQSYFKLRPEDLAEWICNN